MLNLTQIALGVTSFLIIGTALKKLMDPTALIPAKTRSKAANMLANISQVLSGFQLGLMYLNISVLLEVKGSEGLAHFALMGNVIAFSIATVAQYRYPMDITIKIWGFINLRPGVAFCVGFTLLNAAALIL
jgi:hypothetical protein